MQERKKANIPVLIFLALFLGGIGTHKFYLRKLKEGYLYLLFSWTLIPSCLAMGSFLFFAFANKEKKQQYIEGKALIGRRYFVAGVFLYFLPSSILFLLATLPVIFASNYYRSPISIAYSTARAFHTNVLIEMNDIEFNNDTPYSSITYSRDNPPHVFDPRFDDDVNIKGELTVSEESLYSHEFESTMKFSVNGSCYIIRMSNDGCLHFERAPEYPECSEYAALYPVVIQHIIHMASPVTCIGLGINWIRTVYWWDFYQNELYWKQKLSSSCR